MHTPSPFSAYQWRHRLIVIYAAAGSDAQTLQQESWLHAQSTGLLDRDIRVIKVELDQVFVQNRHEPSLNASQIRTYYHLPIDSFAIHLIGKDGTVKWELSTPRRPEAFFEIIDAMPMRQQEMREERQ